MLTLAIAFAVALQGPPQVPSTSTTGSLAGCVLDAGSQRLSGAAIVIRGGGVQRTAVADADGCYQLSDLPAASYRVTARLAGFNNATRDRVAVAPATVAHLDFTMAISAICECIGFGGPTLAEQWASADAVLHVRLSASEPEPTMPVDYYRHAATVLDALKAPAGPRGAPVYVLQNQRTGAAPPYDLDQELVVFLRSWGSNGFAITNDEPGLAGRSGDDPAIVFLVQDGRIQRAPPGFSRYVGMPIDVFIEQLRSVGVK